MFERMISVRVARRAVAVGCAIAFGLAFAAPAMGMGEPALVRDIRPGPADSGSSFLMPFDGRLYLSADDGESGSELWRSDGTESGTNLLADIFPGPDSSFPVGMTDAFGELIFRATDDLHGTEPWASNGTAAGTAVATDVNPGAAGSDPRGLALADGRTFFEADDGTNGNELWLYEGAQTGATLVKDVNPDPGSSGVQGGTMVAVGDTVYFGGDDGTGLKLWKSDGTADGTKAVSDDVFVTLTPLLASDGKLLFAGLTVADGTELWISDGTDAGTKMVEDIDPGADGSLPGDMVNADGTILFAASDGTHGRELWTTDGTPEGTEMVEDINPGSSPSLVPTVAYFVVVGDTAYFAAGDTTHGRELWRSDGTPGGTEMVEDIRPGSPSSFPGLLRRIGDGAFFSANDGTHGDELWRTDEDGTDAVMVGDVAAGAASSSPGSIAQVGGDVFFVAWTEAAGRELWRLQLDVPPVAVGNSGSVVEDATATPVGVLGNDTDADGGPRSIGSVTQPANGEVVVTGGGSGLTYEPDADYCNDGAPTDDFTYALSPGGDTATVAMTVSCVDDPPVAADDSAGVSQDAPATAVDVLGNDTDADGGPISVGSVTQPGHGEVVVTGGGSGLSYRPNAGYCDDGASTDDFTYALSPGGDTATVAMTVACDPPPPPESPTGVVGGDGDDTRATTEGAGVSVPLTCTRQTACEGEATLKGDVPNALLATISRVVVLARGGYSIPAGQTREVHLRLTPAGRRALRALGSIRGTIEIVDEKTGALATIPVRVIGDPIGTAAANRAATVRKGIALLRLRCRGAGACRGRATLAVEARRGGGRTVRLVVGSKRFAIRAGKAKTLRIPLNRAGRSRLARAASGRLRVKLAGSGVKPRAVTLKAARR